MKNRILIPMIVVFLAAIYSCKKDDMQTSNPAKVNSMSEFNAAHKKPTQHFTINSTSGGSIVTTGGIEFNFPPNSLVNSAGNAISGNVDVEIDEVISKADMFFNEISTHSDGRPLKSGGAFRIKVTQGSEKLSMASGQQYQVLLTSNYSEPLMNTYYGLPSTDQYGIINWTTTPPGFTQNVFTHTTDSVNVYEMFVEHFDWINCDYPYDSLFSTLNITLPDGSENCQIMVIDNSAMFGINLWNYGNTAKWDYAPLNKSLSVVVMIENSEVFKVSAKTFLFTGQQITMPELTTISEADLETLINTFQ
ncbi:MAG: hypothetical protein KA521_11865 [Crocinitomicaceae bacterium]|nr:hypothetical protein [Crocinitomicaceae bacterium]